MPRRTSDLLFCEVLLSHRKTHRLWGCHKVKTQMSRMDQQMGKNLTGQAHRYFVSTMSNVCVPGAIMHSIPDVLGDLYRAGIGT